MEDAASSFSAEELKAADRRPPALQLAVMAVVVSIIVGLTALVHYYIGHRLTVSAELPSVVQRLAFGVLALGFFLMVSHLRLPYTRRGRFTKAFSFAALTWMGTFFMLFCFCALGDLFRVVAQRLFHLENALMLYRIEAALVVGGAAWVLPWGFYWARKGPLVEEVEHPISGLHPDLEGFRIVQITDLHVGNTLDGEFIERLVEAANSTRADLFAVTGDIADGTAALLHPEVTALSKLRAPHGTYYVTGNHDYYYGALGWIRVLRSLGLEVLLNEHRRIEKGEGAFVLAGVTDYDAGRILKEHATRPDLAFKEAPSDLPRVLLAHQPRSAKGASAHKVALQLSGHTHGGQFFPITHLVWVQQPMNAGLKYLHGVRVYTSRGSGYWGPPFRIGTKAEITVHVLRRGES